MTMKKEKKNKPIKKRNAIGYLKSTIAKDLKPSGLKAPNTFRRVKPPMDIPVPCDASPDHAAGNISQQRLEIKGTAASAGEVAVGAKRRGKHYLGVFGWMTSFCGRLKRNISLRITWKPN